MSKTNPFAGLLAGFRGQRAEEDKPDTQEERDARRAEEDQRRDDENARRAEEDQRREEEDARRAEEDGSDPKDPEGKRAEEDEDQDPEADDNDDDVDAEEMDEQERSAFRRGLALGRARENARGSRIFLAAAEIGRPDLAATLAFTTRNSSAAANRLMTAAGPAASSAQGSPLNRRMAKVVIPNPGSATGGGKPKELSFGEMALAAGQKAGIF